MQMKRVEVNQQRVCSMQGPESHFSKQKTTINKDFAGREEVRKETVLIRIR